MVTYVSLIGSMLILFAGYIGLLAWYRPEFESEKNKRLKLLKTKEQIFILLFSEIAILRIWWSMGRPVIWDLEYSLLLIILVAMSFFATTDLLEQIVPNKILALFALLFIIRAGYEAAYNMENMLAVIPTILLGLIFCAITFGVGYLLSKKSMGAGDVKLSLLMGLYLTGEYAVAAILYGCMVSALYSVVQMIRHKLTRKDTIPFVPFLYIGVVIRYLLG